MFLVLPLLSKLTTIQGGLDLEEADLLMCAVLKICTQLTLPHNIVEIGSYHGKSTVLIGCVVKEFFSTSKVYAIDPHEGTLWTPENGEVQLAPSLMMFNKNIEDAGLTSIVETIKQCSYNVKWEKPISFLFIDGLHDYENVSRDFHHFVKHMRATSYIAFHDYANYCPGVTRFVNELINIYNYTLVCRAKSLVVLQKTE